MLPGWLPKGAGGTLLEGGAEEAERQKNKNNGQGSVGQGFLLSSFFLPLLSTVFG